MITIWCAFALLQAFAAVSYSIYKQRRRVSPKEYFTLLLCGGLLFLLSPIAGVIASFLVIDKMRADQIDKRDLACSDEGRAIRSMLNASKIRMGRNLS
jgi:hypothetical protein